MSFRKNFIKRKNILFIFSFLYLLICSSLLVSAQSIGWERAACDLIGSNHYKKTGHLNDLNDMKVKVQLTNAREVLVGDVTGDNRQEIIIGENDQKTITVYDLDGNKISSFCPDLADRHYPSILEDYNGDGKLDIGVSSRNIEAGTPLNACEVFFYDGNGNLLDTFHFSQGDGLDGTINPAIVYEGKLYGGEHAFYDANPRGIFAYNINNPEVPIWLYRTGYADISSIAFQDGVMLIALRSQTVINGSQGCGINGNDTCTNDVDMFVAVIDENGNEIFTQFFDMNGNPNGRATPHFIDIDNDGDLEVLVFEGHSNYYKGRSQIHLLDGATGKYLQTFDGISDIGFWYFTYGDLLGNGNNVIATTNTDKNGNDNQYLLDSSLSVLKSSSTSGRIMCSSDLNGDGQAEIILADGNFVKITDTDFNQLWTWDAGEEITDIIVSDLEDDGINEIIVTTSGSNVYVLDAPNNLELKYEDQCIKILLTNSAPVSASEIPVSYDGSVVKPVRVELGDVLNQLNGGNGPDNLNIKLNADTTGCGGAVDSGLIVQFLCNSQNNVNQMIPPGIRQELFRIYFDCNSGSTVGTSSVVAFSDCFKVGPRTVENIISDEFGNVMDVAKGSPISFLPVKLFMRGDSNQDGSINLADAVKILCYLFSGCEITCKDAADANDDGIIDLADGIKLLNYLFNGGDLPAPFNELGQDETEDDLDSCDCAH